MRVAQLIDSLHVGGAEKLQVTFAQVARARDMSVSVIRLRYHEGAPIPAQLEALGAQVMTFTGRGMADPQRLWRLVRFLRQGRFDVLQTHLTYSNILGTLAGRLAGIPVVATLHSVALDPIHRPAIHQLEARLLRFGPSRVIAVGYAVAELHRPRIGREIRVIPNAVSEVPPLAPAERAALRREVTGDEARPLLICVGRLTPLKGYPDLIRAFAMLRESHPSAALAIVGGGRLHEELAAQIETLGLSGHAFLLGSRDDVPRLLRASDLYVSASHLEGLPLSILEAMMAGLPVVATSVGDVPRVLVSGTGTTVPPQQPEQLAQAMRAMLDEPEQMRAMGAAGQAHATRHYSLNAWMDQLVALYAEVRAPSAASPQPQREIS